MSADNPDDDETNNVDSEDTLVVTPTGEPIFRRGDVNDDGSVNLADPVAALRYLFAGTFLPGCDNTVDADDNGAQNLADAVFLLEFLFRDGDPVPAPGIHNCGPDPTDDDPFGCAAYTSCAATP